MVRLQPGRAAIVLLFLALCLLPGRATGADDPVVRLATIDWAPFVGRDLPQHGLLAQVIERALARSGFSLELVFLPWTRALREAQTGSVDGVFPVYHSAERAERYWLSRPLPASPVGLCTRAGEPVAWNGRTVSHLARLRLGVVQGYVNHPLIDDPESGLHLDPVRNDLLNLRKLAAGRVDAIVIDHLVLAYHQALDPSLAGLLPVEPPFEQRSTYVALTRSGDRGAALLAALDRGLAELEAAGQLDALLDPVRAAEPRDPP